jgi:hypothetical protein
MLVLAMLVVRFLYVDEVAIQTRRGEEVNLSW